MKELQTELPSERCSAYVDLLHWPAEYIHLIDCHVSQSRLACRWKFFEVQHIANLIRYQRHAARGPSSCRAVCADDNCRTK